MGRPLSLSCLALCTAAVAALAGQREPTFHTGVFLLHVDAEVAGLDRRPLAGMAKEDFQVLDNGAVQQVVSFAADEQPLDLILLFDISGSMRWETQKVAEIARAAIQQLRQRDRVSVMVFNTGTVIVSNFTQDLEMTERAIRRAAALKPNGYTRIQEAVADASNRFIWFIDERLRQRRAVIVVTDDFGLPSRRKKAILERLWEADSLVSGLIVKHALIGKTVTPMARRGGGVDNFVEQTGGDFIWAEDLATDFPEMIRRIRTRYTLYYKIPDGQIGALRKVDVKLSAAALQRLPGAHVVSRHAYRLRERDQDGLVNR